MAKYSNFTVTKEFLDKNKNAVFVFGDNNDHRGYGGGAALRDHPQTYGFITKRCSDNDDFSFYRPKEYEKIFENELTKLINYINEHPLNTFYISQLGNGLANKYYIWHCVIKNRLEIALTHYENVVFLWDEEFDLKI